MTIYYSPNAGHPPDPDPEPPPTDPPPWAVVRHRRPARVVAAVRRHVDLLTNSGSMMAATVVNSVLGFAYWWLAARAIPAETVGAVSAAVSAMTVLGTLGMFGMGTLLVSELPRLPTERRWSLVYACLVAAGVAAGLLALCWVTLTWYAVPALRGPLATPDLAVLLVVATALTAVALVLDEGLIGLLAGRFQLARNTYFSAGKLLALGALVLAGVRATEGQLFATWIAGILVSLPLLAVSLARHGRLARARPDFATLRRLHRRAVGHSLLNMALFLPRTALPLVVAVVLSPRDAAGFYTAWMVNSFLAMVPSALATTLLAVAGGTAAAQRAKLRMALFVSVAAGLPAALALAVLARPVMGLFGPEYAVTAGGALAVLALTYVPTVFRQLFVALARVRGFLRTAIWVALLAGAAELTAAWYVGSRGDLTSFTIAFATVVAAEGVVMAPIVVRVALARPGGAA